MPSSSSHTPRDSPARRQRRRRTHHRTDSNGELLGRYDRDRERDRDTPPTSPQKSRSRPSQRPRRSSRAPESEHSRTASTALSAGQLAQLDQLNRKLGWNQYDQAHRPREGRDEAETRGEHDEDLERELEERRRERERRKQEYRERKRRHREEEEEGALVDAEETQDLVYEKPQRIRRSTREERRVASGQALERGSEYYYHEKREYRDDLRRRDGSSSGNVEDDPDERKKKRRRNIFIAVGVVILILAIAIPVGVVVSKKDSSGSSGSSNSSSSTSSGPSNSNLDGISESSIPAKYKGTYLDPFTWYDTTGFNVTFTDVMVGGLSIMGLNSTWSDDTRANDNVPALDETWSYGTMPVRGINLGGWLSIEPFITPSLFSSYTTRDSVVDEWTLCDTLGNSTAKTTIEEHYWSFVSEETFADIQAAGFDHVRIPFSYWAVTTYDGDPYVPHISWRYLLRGIEWARKYGLRVNLDLHGVPGSQNGWNHSGHQGVIGWLNGTDGTLNGNRTIAIHNQLSTFFAQDRYKNIIAMYGLVNEPRMTVLDTDTVLDWTETAIATVRANNYTGVIVFGDGFLGLANWQGKLTNYTDLLLDAHQYVIFNVEQIVLNHHDKINFACGDWTQQTLESENTTTGFGPTLTGEWSQGDTDCAEYLNNVGVGSRWEGTLNEADTPGGSNNDSVLTPSCPTDNDPACSCTNANADPSAYSAEYKDWLLMFAEAQMYSFEQGWGWFYWTWQTESASQWSYKAGLAAGILPTKTWERSWNCSTGTIPEFSSLGLPEYY